MSADFSPLTMQLLRDRPSAKDLASPTHIGKIGDEGGGDYVTAQFIVIDDVIRDFGYRCNGCPTTIACCELFGALAKNRQFDLIAEITPETLSKLLGEVPEGKGYVPEFVAGIVRNIFRYEPEKSIESLRLEGIN